LWSVIGLGISRVVSSSGAHDVAAAGCSSSTASVEACVSSITSTASAAGVASTEAGG
jgi:hypothetical protein